MLKMRYLKTMKKNFIKKNFYLYYININEVFNINIINCYIIINI